MNAVALLAAFAVVAYSLPSTDNEQQHISFASQQNLPASRSNQVDTPEISPEEVGGTASISSATEIKLECDTTDATLYYTTDGTTPHLESSMTTKYVNPFKLNANPSQQIVSVYAVKAGMLDSQVKSRSYLVKEKVATPVVTPNCTGVVTTETKIFITSETANAQIHYTLDESTPDKDSPKYTAPFTLEAGTTVVRAIGYQDEMFDSSYGNKTIKIENALQVCSSPTISPADGIITNKTEIKIVCNTDGAKIVYTKDGTDPTPASTEYQLPFVIEEYGKHTVKAIATKDGMLPCKKPAVAKYEILEPTKTPEMHPNGGSIYTGMLLDIESEPGATIYYKFFDGADAAGEVDKDNGTKFEGKFSIDSVGPKTLKAVAFKEGKAKSVILILPFHVYSSVGSAQGGGSMATQQHQSE